MSIENRFLKRAIFPGILAILVLALFPNSSIKAQTVSPIISTQMGIGSRGSEVTKLQEFLANNSNIYPEMLVTGYYGPLTMNAVTAFQIAYDLPPVGRVGPLTLAKINSVGALNKGIDISAPIMSNLTLQGTATASNTGSGNTNPSTVTINWTTNEEARAKVYYSTSPIVVNETERAFTEPAISGTLAPTDSINRVSQSVTLTNLQGNTFYYYVVESIDPSGNVSITLPTSFRTQ